MDYKSLLNVMCRNILYKCTAIDFFFWYAVNWAAIPHSFWSLLRLVGSTTYQKMITLSLRPFSKCISMITKMLRCHLAKDYFRAQKLKRFALWPFKVIVGLFRRSRPLRRFSTPYSPYKFFWLIFLIFRKYLPARRLK